MAAEMAGLSPLSDVHYPDSRANTVANAATKENLDRPPSVAHETDYGKSTGSTSESGSNKTRSCDNSHLSPAIEDYRGG
ncbi:hypothetical protein [Burkholderia sp. PAMC 26561]|uniref:hypothetical protein n=1 Tax=Burkholderia sp. PAMC 26561 TaxID=1795043 RepID=UPI003FA449A8